jgi:hypothetical protein
MRRNIKSLRIARGQAACEYMVLPATGIVARKIEPVSDSVM